MPKKLSPLEQIAAGITSDNMDLVRAGYEALTGIVLKETPTKKQAAPAKRGRPKKVVEEKVTRRPKGPLGLLMDKYQAPDAAGQVKVLGNNFVDDRVSCREAISADEKKTIEKIQGLIGAKSGPDKRKVKCCKCGKQEMVSGLLAAKSRHYCDKCLAAR